MRDAQHLAFKIRRIAKAKGINVNMILTDCGINKNMINEMERRNSTPSYDKIAKIAQYLNVSTDYLLGLTDTMVTTPQGGTIEVNNDEGGGGQGGDVLLEKLRSEKEQDNLIEKITLSLEQRILPRITQIEKDIADLKGATTDLA